MHTLTDMYMEIDSQKSWEYILQVHDCVSICIDDNVLETNTIITYIKTNSKEIKINLI